MTDSSTGSPRPGGTIAVGDDGAVGGTDHGAGVRATLRRISSAIERSARIEPVADRSRTGGVSTGKYAAAGLAAGIAVAGGAVAGGRAFISGQPGAWFFGTPRGPLGSVSTAAAHPPAVAVLAVYGGLVALAVVWWRLVRGLRANPGLPVRQVVRVIAVWAVPFLLAPPLFSRDVYSYAGQGQLVSLHIDPYLYGTGVLGVTPFSWLAGPLWANTPSPYGPTFLSLDGLATMSSGHQVLADVALLRLVAVAGIALVVAGLPTLARRAGQDPAAAVVLGAGSPLVLGTLVGGAHNDALMVGLLVAGLAAWQRFGPVPGIVLCALATGVKFPAVLGVVAIGWNWLPPGAGEATARRMARTVAALGIGTATLAAESAATGIGWGWVRTAAAPDKISTGVTPVNALAHLLGGALHLAGIGTPLTSVRVVLSTLGMAAAVAVGTWVLWRSPRTGAVRAVGVSLLVLALLSPVLWAWYATWGLVVLAPVATGALRRTVMWLIVAEAVIGASAVLGILRTVVDMGPWHALLVVAGVAAAGVLAGRPSYEPGASRPRRSPWRSRSPRPAGVTVSAIRRSHSGR